jgi:hypothetical protein
MADELRFAVKCGGSAKKLQLSSTTAIQIKNPAAIKKELATGTTLYTKPVSIQHQARQHSSSNNLSQQQTTVSSIKSDCKKCEEIIRNELLDSLTPTNALVCKHNSQANTSTLNPSVLIVNRDMIDETQQQALHNSHVLPHTHLNMSHERAKQLFYQQHPLNARKELKKQKSFSTNESTTTDEDLYYLSNAHSTSSHVNPEDHIQMKEFILDSTTASSPIAFLKPNKHPMKQSKLQQHVSKKQQFTNMKTALKPQQVEQQQVTRRNVPMYGQEIPINIASNDLGNQHATQQYRLNQQSMERDRAHQRELTQQEQQINYEKYLSKSTIVKQSYNRS